jgi:iron complex outermembrane receptor protein
MSAPIRRKARVVPRPDGARVSAVMALLLGAGTAMAQQQGQAIADASADPASLRPVTITVNRGVSQSTFDTPASVDIIEAATLREAQLQVNLSETLSRAPGIVALNRQNYAQDLQISSRGFGARATFGVRGIRLYADGIPASGPDGQGQVSHFDLASAARVEVLRGPFSVLYGNSSGGVISLYTEDPGPGTVADVSTTFGSDGVRRTGLKLGGTQGAFQYQVSASHFATDGTREHSAARRESLNAKFRYQLNQDSRITVVLNSVDMPDVQDPLGLTRAELLANPRQATPVALQFNTRKSVNQTQMGLVWDQRLSGQDALQVTVYGGERATTQFQSIPVAAQASATHPGGVIDLGRTYQGLDARWIRRDRLLDRALTLTAGVAMDQLNEDRRGYQNYLGATLGVQGAQRRNERNRVGNHDRYIQADWALADRWQLLAGLRQSTVRFESKDNYIVPGNGDDSGSARFAATTPALGIVFHATNALNLYASAGRGFETPTFNELAYRANGATGLNFGINPARSRQFEVGAKAELGASWRLNAALYQANTQDEIVVQSNTGGRSVFQNAGRTTRRGAEASLSGRWGQGWSTYWALSTVDAFYADAFRSGTTSVAAGNRIPGIPRVSAYGEVAWQHQPLGLRSALEWRSTSRLYVNDTNSDSAAGANILSLRVSMQQKIGAWSVSEFLRVDNLANKQYEGSVIVNEGNSRFFEPAPGRTWLVGVNARYAF